MGYVARDGSSDGREHYVPRVSLPPSGPQLVQQKTGGGTSKNSVFSFDLHLTLGNLVVVSVSLNTTSVSSIDIFSVDSLVQQIASNGTGITTELWSGFVVASAGATDVNVSLANDTDLVVNMSEWSGISSATAEDVSATQGVALDIGYTDPLTGTVTPSYTRNLILAASGWLTNSYSAGPTDGLTRMEPVGESGVIFQETAYKIQTSATAKQTSWSIFPDSNWAAAIAVFGG